MTPIAKDELVIVRHAPADHGGRLCGRTDVPALVPARSVLAPLRMLVGQLDAVTSPARRCRETALALFDRALFQDDRLWEQDFGTHDGLAFEDLPDLGALILDDLAREAAPQGESFVGMVERVTPALVDHAEQVWRTGAPVVMTAHAGTARAALALALGDAALALKFEIAPLSLTRLRCLEGGFSIVAVNERVVG